jgi:serine/threonine protein kinase/WD40 repeat protein
MQFNEGRTLGPSCVGENDDMADTSVLLGQLAEEFTAGVRAGRLPDVEDYARRHPELAERIRALFPTLLFLEGVAGGPSADPGRTAAHRFGRAQLEAGQAFGPYRIERELGRGGMGVVYEAVHQALGKRVALKVLPLLADQGASQLERFLREAQTAAGLHHTNIVPVFDIGQADGLPYYAMQLIPGRGLDQVLADRRDLGAADWFRQVAGFGVQAAEGLAYAHQRGVIHRDIKPSNLLLDEQGVVWITDFGLARRADDAALTQSGALVGTPRYMSPEQAQAARRPVDHRTDVYSLGATLYELVTRRAPFSGDTPVDVLLQVIEREPVAPRRLDRSIPRDLETVVLKAMAKRPQDRYQTAAALADDLQRWLKTEPIQARRIGPVGRTVRWCRRNPALAAVTATAAAVILGLSGYYYASLLDENEQTRAALGRETQALTSKQQALAKEQQARHEAERARDQAEGAREQARDHLLHSLYERVKTQWFSQQPGRRWQSLELLRQAELLRKRKRAAAAREGPLVQLPSWADLRSEAVKALLWLDSRVVREINPDLAFCPWALSPDGRWAAAVFQEKIGDGRPMIRLFDTDDGREQHRWVLLNDDLKKVVSTAAALSPDGKVLATSGGHAENPPQVKLWEVASGKHLATLPWPVSPVPKGKPAPAPANGRWPLESLAFSPDGRFLAGHAVDPVDGTLRLETFLWDLQKGGRPPRSLRADLAQPGVRPAFNRTGALLACQTGDRKMTLWDLAKDTPAREIELHATVRGGPTFSADDRYLAVPAGTTEDGPGLLIFYDLARNAEPAFSWQVGTGAGLTTAVAAFSPDGKRLALADVQGGLTLYGVSPASTLVTMRKGLQQAVPGQQLFWRPEGRLLSVRYPAALKAWEIVKETPYSAMGPGTHRPWPRALALLASVPGQGVPAVLPWGGLAVTHRADWPAPPGAVSGFAFSPDGRWLAITSDENVHLVRRATGEIEHVFRCLASDLLFRPDSRQLAAFGVDTVRVWDVATGKEVGGLGPREFSREKYQAAMLARTQGMVRPGAPVAEGVFPHVGFSPDGRALALKVGVASGLWNAVTGKEEYRLWSQPELTYLSPRGHVFVPATTFLGVAPPPLLLTPLPGFGPLPEFTLVPPPASGMLDGIMTASPDGSWLATNVEDQISFRMNRTIDLFGAAVKPRVVLWRLARQKVRAIPLPGQPPPAPPREIEYSVVLKQHELRLTARALAHAFSPDNRFLAMAFADGSVQVWHVGRGEELFRWTPHTPPIGRANLAFSPDNTTLAGCDGRQSFVWALDLPRLRRELAEVGFDWETGP